MYQDEVEDTEEDQVELDEEDTADSEGFEEFNDTKQPKKIAKPSVKRQKWTQKELEELRLYFKSYLDNKITPRSHTVDKAKAKSSTAGGELHRRANHLIVKKISALNHKK